MTIDEAKAYYLETRKWMELTLSDSYWMDECGINIIMFVLQKDGTPLTLINFDNDTVLTMRKGYGNYG